LVRAVALWEQSPAQGRYSWPAGAVSYCAVPAMTALLKDPDPRVRAGVARGIAEIGLDPRALPALAAMLRGNDELMTKYWAAEALRGYDSRNGFPDPQAAAPLAEFEAALKRPATPKPAPKPPDPPEVF
jgi:HEAT repeat protein